MLIPFCNYLLNERSTALREREREKEKRSETEKKNKLREENLLQSEIVCRKK